MSRVDIDHEIVYNDTLCGGEEESEIILVIRASDVAGYFNHPNGDNQKELVARMLAQPRLQKQLGAIDPGFLRQHLNYCAGDEGRAGDDHDANLRHFLGRMLEDFRCNIEETGEHGYPTRPLKDKGLH
jgi:hypothetical protein